MDTVVFGMMLLVCFNYILKQTYRKIYFVAFSAAVCALFVGLMWPYAIEQSKTQISDWLENSSLMLDIAVILTLEVVLQMAFCILAANIQTSGKVKPPILWLYRFLRWFPGVLIFPVLFSLLVAIIFALPGVSFSYVAWSLAGVITFIIPMGSWLLRWLLPEKEIRLEILFLSNALIALLGIIATVNGQTAVAGISELDWMAFMGVGVFLIVGFFGGIVLYHVNLKRIIKNR